MGMSANYAAIAIGATHVRVGNAISGRGVEPCRGSTLMFVVAGLDLAIQLFAKRMDGRVKPGHDDER